MKKLVTQASTFGPYREIKVLDDRYRCDGVDLPFTVVGEVVIEDAQPGDFPLLPFSNLDEARDAKRLELHAAYETATTSPIVHNSITWAAGREDQSLLVSVLAVGSVPPGMYWRDLSKVPHQMTYADLQALAGTILARGLIADANLTNKLQAVDQAETFAEIDQIVW